MQTESTGPAVPYTRAIAHEAGWRWRIPLQHRVGNGLVYCSRYLSDAEATEKLLREVEGKTIVQPRVIKFRAGRRRKVWHKNVLALGLASGFVEPLESTSIHLIVTGVTRLIHLFPFSGVSQSLVEQYNNDAVTELEKIRDFIVLHYYATERDDSAFWRFCAGMEVPESLAHRLRMFRERAHVWQRDGELFRLDSWMQVMIGQGIRPEHYHPLTKGLKDQDLTRFLDTIRSSIRQAVDAMPPHQQFVDHYARASDSIWTMSAAK